MVTSALNLLGGGTDAAGTVTSGGTESIFLAMKAARDLAHARHGITAPQMVMPNTAHPAFNRHAQILGITPVRVPVGEDFRADVTAMAEAITPDTVLIVGSAPCYPYGLFDPITQLAGLALERGLCMHVDACVGGFQAPFVRALGRSVPDFDLSVAGVTSISADLHKYGFALKGASVVLFAHADLKRFSTFTFEDWPRGLYATDTFSGTRSGGPVAAAWAIMRYLGFDGYVDLHRRIMALRDEAIQQVGALEGCELIGTPELSLIAFTPAGADMSVLSDKMGETGWILNLLREPPSVQLMFNVSHEGRVGEFFADFERALPSARTTTQRRAITADY
ncbi:pyridoxal phosphate-dependent decarboxylase family protein [Rhizobium giardinii]|uniref:Glutamate/tyrosine decarboxylase-like PLP-dependent enzyme n=1 Tax=Rhizobium giardinii TaxID=56731 RepID=A0A7W8UBE5_9HYPH|nr:aminotransferase class V-fold PLP-dependent enzyme [Rhizobium giardinii]MBB5536290.1 glutamate/tyrosine decarboxylase-like PLP-dependent enzyme [Rhizobium giardinii]